MSHKVRDPYTRCALVVVGRLRAADRVLHRYDVDLHWLQACEWPARVTRCRTAPAGFHCK